MPPLQIMEGVGDAEKAPFCCEFVTFKDLCNAFVKYCPRTFKYNGCASEGVDETVVTSNENTISTPEQTMANHIQESLKLIYSLALCVSA
eukprot:9435954-Ditylum_brightwellii.AAC.1